MLATCSWTSVPLATALVLAEWTGPEKKTERGARHVTQVVKKSSIGGKQYLDYL